MKPFTDFLGDFEKLAYKFLMFIIFIPKTLFQIIVNPGWVPQYLKSELEQQDGKFDQYLSPIALLLIVAFLPALIYGLLPPIGAGITHGPAEKEVIGSIVENMITADPSWTRESAESYLTNRFVKFEATTTYASGSNNMAYLHSWYVEKVNPSGEPAYEEIYRVNYNSKEYPVESVNNRTTKDSFYYSFDEAGEYFVNVEVEKYYQNNNIPVESFVTYLYVYVPDKAEKSVEIFSNTISPTGSKPETKKFSERLKDESNALLALGLLIPPLLFALVTKLFTKKQETSENSSKEGFYEISETSLKESFFAQCYYFSPIGLAIWAVVYSGYYLTPDIFFYKGNNIGYVVILLPLLLAVIWFIGVETEAIARERSVSPVVAFLMTLFSIGLLLALALLVISFSDIHDPLRKTAIWLYLLGSAGLLIVIAIAWLSRKRTENGSKNNKVKPGEVILIASLLLVIALVILAFLNTPKLPPSTPKPEITQRSSSIESEGLSTPIATEPPTEALPTDTPLPETQPFYTEEFDNPLSSDWSVFTVADSDQAHVDKVTVEAQDGKLVWNFDSVYVYYYLFNGAFRYDDVRMDVRADNRGRNNNNISLICRYDPNVGWYEFNIANNGLYDIFYAEVASNGKVVYNSITNGGSNSIKIGREVNEYSITCKGQQLTLFINGDEVNSVAEKNYGLREGQVGVSVSSFDVLPILIEMDWIKISEP